MFLPVLWLAACRPAAAPATPAPFSPPTLALAPTPVASSALTAVPPSPTPSCDDGLLFLEDLTIPDGTIASPGETLDKRWQVRNSGTCNWDEGYALILVTGPDLGAVSPQALYPALAGSEATIRIAFTAPGESGIYRSAWQAADPSGQPFGDWIFIEIIVP